MNHKAALPGRQFQGSIYRDLDRKLKNSRWNGGASEAHGLLSALACRGVPGEQIRAKAWLFQLSEKADVDLLEGMYGLILRDLQSDGFEFDLLLPGDEFSESQKIDALADWCDGFIQGFFHDGEEDIETRLDGVPDWVRKSVNDIMEIIRISGAGSDEETERQLFDIEEYLRVAVRAIFEELNPDPRQPAGATRIN